MRSSREVLLLAVLPLALLAAGCTKEAPAAGPAAAAAGSEAAAAGTAQRHAVVVFVSGKVEASDAAGRTTVEVGDTIVAGQALATGAGSECELRLGEGTTVRIEENTEILLSSLVLDPGRTRIGTRTILGSIRCKVAKLAGDERFQVSTQTAVIGVRGTEFGVTVSAGGDTLLAVQEGAVAILPASIDVEALAARLTTDDPDLSAALAELGKAELVVQEAGRAVVTEAAFRRAGEIRSRVERAIEAVSASERPTAAEKRAFSTAMRSAAAEIRGSMVAPAAAPSPGPAPAPAPESAPSPGSPPPSASTELPLEIAIRNGSFERPADASGDLVRTDDWSAGGSWFGRLAWVPGAARDGSAFVWASYERGGSDNGYAQELDTLCVAGRYELVVWINADGRGLVSRIEVGYDAGDGDYRVIGTDSRESPYGHDAGAAWGSRWIRQTLVVDVPEGGPAVGKPLWVRLTNATAASPKRETDGTYGNSVSWDGVTLTLSPGAERGE